MGDRSSNGGWGYLAHCTAYFGFYFSHSGGLVNPNSRVHSSPFSLKRFFLSPTKFFFVPVFVEKYNFFFFRRKNICASCVGIALGADKNYHLAERVCGLRRVWCGVVW